MVERFNGRIATEVLPINVANHADLEILLRDFNRTYNHGWQRMLGGISPTAKAGDRLKAKPHLGNRHLRLQTDPAVMIEVDSVMLYAKDISRSNN